MKYNQLKSFEKHLQAASPAHFSPLYAVIAKDAFDRKEAIECIIQRLIPNEKERSLNVTVFPADRFDLQAFLQEWHSLSFFFGQRVIVIEEADKLPKNVHSKLVECFKEKGINQFLVITAAQLQASNSFFKSIEQYGVILDIPEEKIWEKEKTAAAWIIEKTAVLGKSIDMQAAQFLVKHIGSDKALLFQELNKLACYVGQRQHISSDDMIAICNAVNQETIWQLGEAVFSLNAGKALTIVESLLNQGAPFLSLLRQLRSQIETGLQVSCLINNNAQSEIQKQFPYMRGQILDRHMNNARTYGLKRFIDGLLLVDEAELTAKNSGFDDILIAEMLICKLTR